MADKLCPLMRAPSAPGAFSHAPPAPGEAAPAPCIEHRCRWYIQLIGTNPQTGEQRAEWGCAVEFLPILLIENAKETRQAAAATEAARNVSAGVAASVAELAREVRESTARTVAGEVLGELGEQRRLAPRRFLGFFRRK